VYKSEEFGVNRRLELGYGGDALVLEFKGFRDKTSCISHEGFMKAIWRLKGFGDGNDLETEGTIWRRKRSVSLFLRFWVRMRMFIFCFLFFVSVLELEGTICFLFLS
jgi:hypothetical protein